MTWERSKPKVCLFFHPSQGGSTWFFYYLILTSTWCQTFGCVWVTGGSVRTAPRWLQCAGNTWTEAHTHTHTSFFSPYFPTLAASPPLEENDRWLHILLHRFSAYLSPLTLSSFDWLSSEKHRCFHSGFFIPVDLLVSGEQLNNLQMVYQSSSTNTLCWYKHKSTTLLLLVVSNETLKLKR